jgi:hypothetical protein
VLACLIILVLSGNIRYRASIEPFTVLLASVAIARIVAWYGVGLSRNRVSRGTVSRDRVSSSRGRA